MFLRQKLSNQRQSDDFFRDHYIFLAKFEKSEIYLSDDLFLNFNSHYLFLRQKARNQIHILSDDLFFGLHLKFRIQFFHICEFLDSQDSGKTL